MKNTPCGKVIDALTFVIGRIQQVQLGDPGLVGGERQFGSIRSELKTLDVPVDIGGHGRKTLLLDIPAAQALKLAVAIEVTQITSACGLNWAFP